MIVKIEVMELNTCTKYLYAQDSQIVDQLESLTLLQSRMAHLFLSTGAERIQDRKMPVTMGSSFLVHLLRVNVKFERNG